jgi:hypothetical protein
MLSYELQMLQQVSNADATELNGLDNRGVKNILLSNVSTPAPPNTQPPLQWVPELLRRG